MRPFAKSIHCLAFFSASLFDVLAEGGFQKSHLRAKENQTAFTLPVPIHISFVKTEYDENAPCWKSSHHNRPANRTISVEIDHAGGGGRYLVVHTSESTAVATTDINNGRNLQKVGNFENDWKEEAIGAGATGLCVAASVALAGPTGGASLAWGSYVCSAVGFWTVVILNSIDWGNPKADNAWLSVRTGDIDTADGNALAISYHRDNGDIDNDSLGSIGRNEVKEWEEDLDASRMKYIELRVDDWDDVCVEVLGLTVGEEPSGTGRKETIQLTAPLIAYMTDGRVIMHRNSCVFFGDSASGAIGNLMFHWPSALTCFKNFAGYQSLDLAYCMAWATKRYDILKPGGGYTRYDFWPDEPSLPSSLRDPFTRLSMGSWCADLLNGATNNGQPVNLRPCRSWSEDSQAWDMDMDGSIRSRIDPSKCLEAGGQGNLYEKAFVWDCHGGIHQKWSLASDGRIKNKAFDKYLGVAYCGQNPDVKTLELRNWESGACGGTQIWSF